MVAPGCDETPDNTRPVLCAAALTWQIPPQTIRAGSWDDLGVAHGRSGTHMIREYQHR